MCEGLGVTDIKELKIVPQYDKASVCFFTGNRPHKLPWGEDEADKRCIAVKRKLAETVLSLCKEGKRLFVCGMAQGGDTYFAEAVLFLRSAGYDIELECALPCPEQADKWEEKDGKRYAKILADADYVTTVSPRYTKYCMMARNRYMADKSSVCVSLNYDKSGGAAATLKYAKNKNLRIIGIN